MSALRELTAEELLLVAGGGDISQDPISHDPGPGLDDGMSHDPGDVSPPDTISISFIGVAYVDTCSQFLFI